MENSLKDFVDELLPSSYVKVSEQKEEQRAQEEKHQVVVISSLEEHCLFKFVESLRNSLGLLQEQAFDWHWFFTSKADRNYTDMELLDQGFEVCGFVVQYAVLQVQHRFLKIICCAEARQQLLNLIEVLWVESQVNRGYKYQTKNVFPINQVKKQAVYDWFKQPNLEFKRDRAPEVELEFPIEQQQSQRQDRTTEEVFLLLLAQACYVPYPAAFKKISDDPWLCLQEKLMSAADEALAVSGLTKKTVLNNKQRMLLYIRLTSHYYADKQVRSGSSAANVQMAALRAKETEQILQLLKS